MQEEKSNFFKDVKKSIVNFDKYEDFAISKTGNSIKYILILMFIFSVIIYALFLYKFSVSDEEGLNFFKNNILNLNYDQEEISIEGIDSVIVQNKNNTIIPVWIFILYLTSALVDAAILAILGIIISRVARVKIPYKANFNMAVHALTLSIILEAIYILVHSFTGFEIRYFNFMYTAISYIYMIVAILMIKTDLINKQLELIKLQEEQQKVREQMQNENEKENQEKPKKKEKKNDDKQNDNDEEEGNIGTSEV